MIHNAVTSTDKVGVKKSPFGTLDRRQVLKGFALTGAALSVPALLKGGSALAADGGTMTWAKPLETTMLDPQTSILGSSWQTLHLIYDSLVDMDDQMNLIPALAESWEQTSPTTYVFKLRQGVKFSNGRDMTVEDAVGSIQRIIDPKTGSYWALEMGAVKEIKKLDNSTMQIELSSPHTPLIHALSATMSSIMPMKEIAAGEMDPTKQMLGTGPFMVESHAQDDHWVLVRNPHYWRAGLPKLDKVIIKILPSDQARIAGLRDGSIDIASFEASPDAPLLLKNIENVTVHVEDVTNYYFFAMNAVWDQSPFSNQKLRQAVALTIDRNKIRDFALGGAGEPTSAMAPGFNKCDTSKLPVWNRNIDQAKALLKESGAEGIEFELLVRSLPADIQMAQVIKQGVAEIGLTANISVVDEGTWVKRAWVDNPSQFEAMVTWYAGYSDPVMSTLWYNPEKAGFTAGHMPMVPELNKLMDDGFSQPNGPERDKTLQALCAKIDELAVKVPLVTRQDTVAYRSDKITAKLVHLEGYVNTLRGVEEYTRN
jgi:peptide/nickel transport system substrate-binding protein